MIPRSLKGRLMLAGMAGALAAAVTAAVVIAVQFWPGASTAEHGKH